MLRVRRARVRVRVRVRVRARVQVRRGLGRVISTKDVPTPGSLLYIMNKGQR